MAAANDLGPRPPLVEALPERTRLFHIGPPKTGTTSLQAAAAASRPQLLEHGVLYPGQRLNHNLPIAAFLGRPMQFHGAKASEKRETPSLKPWRELLTEINAEPERRIWFGHEYAAGADVDQVRRFAHDIGPTMHVVVTLRSFTRMLPSIWQEFSKTGNSGGLDRYVTRQLSVPEADREQVGFHRRHNQGRLVQRWAEVLGPERVTVVVADRHDHAFSAHAFEDLLGLPRDLIAQAPIDDRHVNRSLSLSETELFRRLNKVLRHHQISWADYKKLMVDGGIYRVLSSRKPKRGEPRVRLSPAAASAAFEYQQQSVQTLLGTGVRIIGDVANLQEPASAQSERDAQRVAEVPIDLAVQLAAGIVAAATGKQSDFTSPSLTPADAFVRLAVNLKGAAKQFSRDLRSSKGEE